ncbi:YbjQ family protein [Cuneatibacter sp. NSJ-177]|uniref:heavy metal-binding domain-containing protein n=1 Tax=Cuneatibacter sp. NSJ-177 TaxID=2931401 RepID=UPI001FD21AE9|nr:heavy metal-binding domain-containing protein [Cuneatibacter sp. NSJ-177]MCJ7836026.1 YbjQ family protein [Cuneatibacter sp. NSJ-177]
MSEVLITTGYNFEGYHIVKYLGVVSANLNPKYYLGDMLKKVDVDNVFKKIKAEALERLTEEAIALGGNGVIGLQWHQFEFGIVPCLSCIATAVLLVKEKN